MSGRPDRPWAPRTGRSCRLPPSRRRHGSPPAGPGRHEPVEEPRAAAPAFPPGRRDARGRPRQPQVAARAGDPDVEEAPLLGQLGGLGRLADRQRAFLERRQEHGVPLEALGAVVGEELDPGRLATGLDRGPAGHLREERGHVRGGVGPDEIVGELEERHDGPVPLARHATRGLRCRAGRPARARSPPRGARRGARRSRSGQGPRRRGWRGAPRAGRRSARPGRGTGSRPRRARSRSRAAPRSSGRGWPSTPCAVPAAARRRIAAVMAASSASSEANPVTSGAGPDGRLASSRLGGRGAAPGRSFVRGDPARGEDPVGERQHLRGRSVVGLERDHPGGRVPRREPGQVVAAGARERVDGLVLVADDRDVLAPAQPRLEERRLERVRVLELVDREPAIPVAHLGRDRVVALDEPDRQLQHVLEVDPAGPCLGRLVAPVQPGHEVCRQWRVAILGEGPRLVRGRPRSGAPWPIRSRRRGRARRDSGSRPAGPARAAPGWAPWSRGSPADPTRGPGARNGAAGGAPRRGTWMPPRRDGRAPPAGWPSPSPPCP